MSENNENSAINDRIWITSRVRMVSEKRSLRNNFLSLLLLTYYSLFAVILSIFSDYYSIHYGHFSSMITAASVIVLVVSLVVSGFRFEKTASLYRDCYLSLQKLASQSIPDAEKEETYNNILHIYPNQSSSDYHDFIITHNFLEDKKIWNREKNITYTRLMVSFFFVRKTSLIIFIVFAIAAPILFLAFPIMSGYAK